MNVMCTQLLHTMRHVIQGGCEEPLGVEVGSCLIKGSRVKFLRALIEEVQHASMDLSGLVVHGRGLG